MKDRGLLSDMRKVGLRFRILSVILAVVAVIQAGLLVFALTSWRASEESVALMRENIELQKNISNMKDIYQKQTVQYWELRGRMGEGYRRVLYSLIDRLGLNNRGPGTVASELLAEFERMGVGGP